MKSSESLCKKNSNDSLYRNLYIFCNINIYPIIKFDWKALRNFFIFICLIFTFSHFNFRLVSAKILKKNGSEPNSFEKLDLINSKQTNIYKHSKSYTINIQKNILKENRSRELGSNILILYAFERSFRLNLNLIENGVLFSSNLNDNFSFNSNLPYSNCLYNGHVDDDFKSILYINLCHNGHVIGSFLVDNKEYFIEPLNEFDSKFFDEYEFSFVDFDKSFQIKESHIILTRKLNQTKIENKFSSCANEADQQNEPTTKSIDEYSIKKRKKRATKFFPYIVDRTIYLELLVVVDYKMYQYYGENLENHILTLMFMTTQTYQHPSLINPVRVYISDIVYIHKLDEYKRKSLNISWNAERLLTEFCRWQYEYRREMSMTNQIDVAILITKHDICKSKDVCQTLGMARLNQVCVPFQNCAVIEDSGINTAYTIAHEIGHLLGMKHVDEERCQDLDTTSTQMMASMLDLTKKAQVWSNCSVLELNDFLRTGDAECLFNIPDRNPNFINKNLNFENTLEQFDERMIQKAISPGFDTLYNLTNQCKQIFGPESDDCDHNPDEDCKILWCKAESPKYDDNSYQCVTTNTKWADGTPCRINGFYGANRCLNGECVREKSEETKPIDGGFSEWSEFTSCSRSCGGGIKKKYRTCDNPKPKNGGNYCIGKRVIYESCNTQDCPEKESNFRDEQCRLSAKRMSNMKLVDQIGFSSNSSIVWKAYYSQDSRRRCVLFCRIEEKSTFAILSPLVIDGTKCGLDSYDICVNGHCLPGGCDNKLYSQLSDDKCGVCGGENKSCKEETDVIASPNIFGYTYLKTIPSRTTSILIHRQRDSDDLGCLALRSSNQSLLNGHYIISKTSTSIDFEGKIIDYIVNETDEIIQSRGNFSEDLIVEFLTGAKKIQNYISFSYYVPKSPQIRHDDELHYNNELTGYSQYDNSELKNSNYDYSFRQNQVKSESFGSDLTIISHCDKMCNGYQKVTIKQCKKRDCQSFQTNQICNTHCNLNLTSTSVGCIPNHGECGEGYENLNMQCMQIYKTSDVKIPVDLSNCDEKEIRLKNSTRKKCYIACDNFEWRTIDIECSCENGFKKFNYACFDKNLKRAVSHSKCRNVIKPITTEFVKCESKCYQWRTSDWYECSKTCGGGEKRRDLYCVFNRSHIAKKNLCESEAPSEVEPCNTHSCATWSMSPWGECIGSCEKGKRNRTVTCVYRGNQVDNSMCPKNSKPSEEEECEKTECYSWKANDWSGCSVTCGKGFKVRSVYCQIERKIINRVKQSSRKKITTDLSTFEKVPDSKCEAELRPYDRAECFIDKICPFWKSTTWSYCDCNLGFKNRFIECSTGVSSDCPANSKPSSRENCTCSGTWKVSRWSQCNNGCSFGWRHRNVTCVNRNGERINSKECSFNKKPTSRERCFDCNGQWIASNWTECSTSCGSGIQSRKVECILTKTGEILPNNKCDSKSMPSEQQVCKINDCTSEWKIISKKPCSVTCGQGWIIRKIECRTFDNKESDECKNEDKPEYYEKCDAGPCPKWEIGGWSACSTDCGQGIRKRLVVCIGSDSNVLDDMKCNDSERPINETSCIGNMCAKWITDKWSDCEMKTCNRIRNVRCGFENGTFLPDNNCDLEKKPSYLTECPSWINCKRYQEVLLKTSSLGVLEYSNWSKCSVKCGLGFRTRNATCRSVSNNSVELPMQFCNTLHIERLKLNCHLAVCSYQLIETWSKCSAKCGQQGVETLERKCYENVSKTYVDLEKCNVIPNSSALERKCYKPCIRNVNPTFEWRVSAWRPCTAKCGFGHKNRTVKCWNLSEKTTTSDLNCDVKNRPVDTLPCLNISCGYGWFVSKWSECSKNCSQGVKTREVYCIKISTEGYILRTTSNRCYLSEKPDTTMPCNFGACNGEYFWKTGNWSKCSPSCNMGNQRRNVYCVHKNGTVQSDFSKCKLDSIPLRQQFCYTNCYAKSCVELKGMFNLNNDDDYHLNISNKIVKIYCKNMNTTKPIEYLTLKSGESKNFAEIYDKKLKQPNKCRYGPRYGSNCSFCQTKIVENHGITLFSKVRLELSTLRIIEDDFTYANVLYGKPVPFGHSGDCYSSVPECQQGRLNIDLRGTNFAIDSSVKWITHGELAHQRIYFSKDNSTIYGTCGGLCGFCKPDPISGIKLRIV